MIKDALAPSTSSSNASSRASTSKMLNKSIPEEEEENTTSKKWYKKPSNWIRILVITILLTTVTTALVENEMTIGLISSYLTWVEENVWLGLFAFVALFIVCTIFMIPGSLLTLGAGYVYSHIFGPLLGVVMSSTLVFVGAFIGATLAFFNGRYLLRDIFEAYTKKHPKFQYIDHIVEKNGFKVVFLLRLAPLTPYNLFNYFMGITSISLSDYCKAHTGMIPDIILFCWIGSSIASIAKLSQVGVESNPILLIITVLGTAIAVVGVIYVTCMAKRQIDSIARQQTEADQNENELRDTISMSLGVDVDETVL